MYEKKLPKRVITFCSVCVLFAGSLYYFVMTAYRQADALANRPVPLELEDLIQDARN